MIDNFDKLQPKSEKLSLNLNQQNTVKESAGFGDISSTPPPPVLRKKLSLNKVIVVNLDDNDNPAFTTETVTCPSVVNHCDSKDICPYTQTNYHDNAHGKTLCVGCDTSDHLTICPCAHYPSKVMYLTQVFAICEDQKPHIYDSHDCITD